MGDLRFSPTLAEINQNGMRPSAWLENVSPHIRESKTVLDSDPRQSWILDSEPCILDSLSMELRSRSRIVGEISWAGFRIPKPGIPDSTSKTSSHFGFHKQRFLDSGIRIPLHEAKCGYKTCLTESKLKACFVSVLATIGWNDSERESREGYEWKIRFAQTNFE